jgi:hypothetical protein
VRYLCYFRTRHCRVPTINWGRETALPWTLYHSGVTGIDIIPRTRDCRVPTRVIPGHGIAVSLPVLYPGHGIAVSLPVCSQDTGLPCPYPCAPRTRDCRVPTRVISGHGIAVSLLETAINVKFTN